jgi:hypothetical protein
VQKTAAIILMIVASVNGVAACDPYSPADPPPSPPRLPAGARQLIIKETYFQTFTTRPSIA